VRGCLNLAEHPLYDVLLRPFQLCAYHYRHPPKRYVQVVEEDRMENGPDYRDLYPPWED